MNIDTVIAILKLVDPRRKPLQRLGKFLCREYVRNTEEELAALKSHVHALNHKLDELERKNVVQMEQIETLRREIDRRSAYRRITIGKASVFALRAEAAKPGEPPRLLCPVCFENGKTGEIVPHFHTRDKYTRSSHKIVEVRCANRECGFSFVTSPDAFNESFKLVD